MYVIYDTVCILQHSRLERDIKFRHFEILLQHYVYCDCINSAVIALHMIVSYGALRPIHPFHHIVSLLSSYIYQDYFQPKLKTLINSMPIAGKMLLLLGVVIPLMSHIMFKTNQHIYLHCSFHFHNFMLGMVSRFIQFDFLCR